MSNGIENKQKKRPIKGTAFFCKIYFCEVNANHKI